MKENTDTESTAETAATNQTPASAPTDEKKEAKKPTVDLDDTDDNKGLYNFYPIEALDFKKTPLRNKELNHFRSILSAPFMNVPLLIVEQQEDALPLLSLFVREQEKSKNETSFFSVTPSDFGMDFSDSDFSYDLRKTLNMGGTILEDGDLKTKIPVYCD